MALKLRAAANTVHSGAEQKLKTSLNLSEGGTTNVHKARSDSPIPPIPAVRCAEWQNPASCGVLFLWIVRRRSTGPLAGLAQV